MNRRTFMRALLAVPLAPFIPIPKRAIDKIYGIDWGLNDATVGTWMGITRSTTPMFHSWVHKPTGKLDKELIAMIRKLMDDGVKHYEQKAVYKTYLK
jgi:hypothetical protein